jgi:hypothetical protein
MSSYSLTGIYQVLQNDIDELCDIVLKLATSPKNLQRDVLIEGCFLRVVVTWENFVEEYFLRCMCSGKTCSGTILRPKTSRCGNTDRAFKRLKATNKGREQEYARWISHDILKLITNEYFHHRSRLHKLYESPDRLYALVTIRNAIVHRSKSAIKKFQNYVINQHGYLATLDPSMAELLITKKRSNSKLVFIDLADYYLGLANDLTK